MCYLETEGTKHGCGHYVISKKLMKHDCGNRYCRNSAAHPPNCPDCQCDLYYGPDRKETITRTVTDYCAHCAYWFKGGAQAARRAQQ
ncbi:hypothetical protein CONPUDRAFT_152244 [Coniophora puteana RWD-64-598 SS2]|uniref:Uncharacterized protein n=1 Tax=Coniophora puteana (strain RWD-64-598) TaxID=741705 RepID=A0A5M3MVM0_CONPW|nr:uncharacterized protein CONPUDRAFT_152244 [Coniophora puteana RWD-64-598 SS2]EIW83208.1 hypothetical protein CONPUDRAFT_152244 [Coniophora puteana RWD-64-598 SS2]